MSRTKVVDLGNMEFGAAVNAAKFLGVEVPSDLFQELEDPNPEETREALDFLSGKGVCKACHKGNHCGFCSCCS